MSQRNICSRKLIKKVRFFCMTIAVALLCTVLSACNGSPTPQPVSAPPTASASAPDDLDTAIRETSDYLNKQLTKGNRLLILNIQSEFPALSEYIIDELIANTVNDRVFSMVDRQQLDVIRAELGFQMSGEVDDATAQALGRIAGAQIIISGAISRIGDLYRLRVRALSVQNAQIEGQFNRNVPDTPTIAALAQSKATGYGGGATTPSGSSNGGNRTPAPASAAVVTPASAPSALQPAQPEIPIKLGVWKFSDTRRTSSRLSADLVIQTYQNNTFIGYFDWYDEGVSGSYYGREHFEGTYNEIRQTVFIKGTRLEKVRNFGLCEYQARVSGDGLKLTDGSWRGSSTGTVSVKLRGENVPWE